MQYTADIEKLRDEMLEQAISYRGHIQDATCSAHVKCLASAADHLDAILMRHEGEDESSQRRMRSYRSYDDGMGYSGARSYADGDPMTGMERSQAYRDRSWHDGQEDPMRTLQRLRGTGDDKTRRVVDRVLREMGM